MTRGGDNELASIMKQHDDAEEEEGDDDDEEEEEDDEEEEEEDDEDDEDDDEEEVDDDKEDYWLKNAKVSKEAKRCIYAKLNKILGNDRPFANKLLHKADPTISIKNIKTLSDQQMFKALSDCICGDEAQ